MRTWIDVAVLAKSRNSKGRFAVTATAGLPFLLEEGDEVAFVPPQLDVPRTALVGFVNLTGDRSAEVTFEDIDDPATMQALVGSHCLIRRDLIDEDEFLDAPGAWEGWRVVDRTLGCVGEVAGIVDNPAQTLIEVSREGGLTSLVPVVDEIVVGIDVASQTVEVDLPKGLLDL